MARYVQVVLLLIHVFIGHATAADIVVNPHCPFQAEANRNVYLSAEYSYTLNNPGSRTLTGRVSYSLCDNQGHCQTGSNYWSVNPDSSKTNSGTIFLAVAYRTSDIGKSIVVTAQVQLSGAIYGTGSGTCSFSVVRMARDLEV